MALCRAATWPMHGGPSRDGPQRGSVVFQDCKTGLSGARQGFLVHFSLVQLYRSLGGGWEYESLPDLSALEKREGGMEN